MSRTTVPRSQYERNARVPAAFVITEWTKLPLSPSFGSRNGTMSRWRQAPQPPTSRGRSGRETSKMRKSGRPGRRPSGGRSGLRGDDRRVDVRAPAARMQPDLVGAARIGADEGETPRAARSRHVVQRKSLEGARVGSAGLDAGDREVPRETRRLHPLHDRLLRPGSAQRRRRPRVAEPADQRRSTRSGEAVDAHALRRTAVLAAVAGEVGVPAMPQTSAAYPSCGSTCATTSNPRGGRPVAVAERQPCGQEREAERENRDGAERSQDGGRRDRG